MDKMVWRVGLVVLGATGCAEGVTADPFELASGIYELSTVAFDGDCVLEDAISPGDEYVGKVVRVDATVRDSSVSLEVCDDFFEDECFAAPFISPISMIREEDDLYASEPNWEVPGCLCFDAYRGEREILGAVVEDGRAELVWSFTLPAAPPDCTCTVGACVGTVTQRLLFLSGGS